MSARGEANGEGSGSPRTCPLPPKKGRISHVHYLDERRAYYAVEVAAVLGVTRRTVWNLRDLLPQLGATEGGWIVYDADAVDEFAPLYQRLSRKGRGRVRCAS